MQAIDTEYLGYRFRSRLEARWAVFLQSVGVDWKYEPEGFKFGNGTRYLPDFHLPRTHSQASSEVYLEVKPEGKTTTKGWNVTSFDHREEINFASSLIVLSGQPRAVRAKHGTLKLDYEGYSFGDQCYYFCQCPECDAIGVEFNGRAERLSCPCSISENHTKDADILLKGYDTASKARFEHGEKV